VWLDRETFDLLADQCLNRRPEAADQNSVRTLTDREQKVLLGVIGGLTNRKIAEVTGLMEGSVKGTLDTLFGKTGTQTRSQLVRIVLNGSSPSRR
jgi:DNA-binding NarL/FixJ family response regulator